MIEPAGLGDLMVRILTLRAFPFLSAAWVVFLVVRALVLAPIVGLFVSAQMRRECLSIAVAPVTYIVATLFVFITSLVFYLAPLENPVASFEPVAIYIKFLGIFFVPLLTMRLVAEERRSGTIELLLTAPVRIREVVLAKFGAGFLFFLGMLAPCAVYAALLMWMGDLDGGETLASLAGLALLGAAYTSIGLFASSCTRSQVAAAMSATAVSLVLWLVWHLGDEATVLGRIWQGLSFKGHLDTSFTKGVVDSADALYFLSVTGFFLFLAGAVLRAGAALGAGLRGPGPRRPFAALVAAVVGGEALLFLVAVLHVTGLSLAQVPQVWRAAAWPVLVWIVAPAAVAMAGGLTTLLLLRRAMAARVRRLAAQTRLPATLVGATGALLVLVNANVLAGWFAWRQDVSEARLHALSPQTERVLDALDEPVHITVFYSSQDRYDGYPLLKRTRGLLEEYTARSSQVLVTYLDPDASLERAARVAREKGLDLERLAEFALVEHRGRRTVVPWVYVAHEQRDLRGRSNRVFRGELAFTNAIQQLRTTRTPHVYVTEEHGEYNAFSHVHADRSMGAFARELRRNGCEVHRLGLVPETEIPADCDMLVLAGPSRPFGTPERTALRAYLDNGGRALFLVDPPPAPGLSYGLDKVLARYGALLQQDLVYDPRNAVGGRQGIVLAEGSTEHPITRLEGGLVCYLRAAQSVGVRSAPGVSEDWNLSYLLATGPSAISVTLQRSGDEKPRTRRGSFPCAAALQGPKGARIVVVGDADLAGNPDIDKAHNRVFLVSAVQWLLDRKDTLSIPSRADRSRRLEYTALRRRTVFWTAVVGVPQIYLLVGALVWWRRRQ